MLAILVNGVACRGWWVQQGGVLFGSSSSRLPRGARARARRRDDPPCALRRRRDRRRLLFLYSLSRRSRLPLCAASCHARYSRWSLDVSGAVPDVLLSEGSRCRRLLRASYLLCCARGVVCMCMWTGDVFG